MRVKKQKRNRRTIRFFSTCFGFREPYKVLCDGTFVHHLLLHGLVPADDALSCLLGGRVQIFASRCAVAELRSLGDSHSDSLAAAQQLIAARCDHDEKRASAVNCVQSIVGGDGNKEHFFVATQDAELRRDLGKVVGVPVIYGIRNSLFVEQPSADQRVFVRSLEEKRLRMSESEYRKLYKGGGTGKKEEGSNSEEPLAAAEGVHGDWSEPPQAPKQKLGVADKVRFKRKRAKGPNPLSCLKKKKVKIGPLAPESEKVASGMCKGVMQSPVLLKILVC